MNFAAFKEVAEISVKRFSECPLGKLAETKTFDRLDRDYNKSAYMLRENFARCPIEGHNGHWDGEPGDSTWKPDRDYTPPPKKTYENSDKPPYNNPENETWGEILDKYGIDGITYKDGEPDFSEISKGTVEIKPFTTIRDDNFDKADIVLANQKGCTPEEVAKWRKENNYTWHECKDQKTMQKVPNEIHANIPHSGGIAEAKKGNGGQ